MEFKRKKHTERIFTEDIEIHVIELNKFREGQEERSEDMLKAKGEEEMEKISKADQAVAEAIEEWKRLVDDPEHHEEFLWREKELRDKISFISQAKIERN